MAYRAFRYLNRRTAADNVLLDKAINIAKDSNDGYQGELAWMVYTFLRRKPLLVVLKMRILQSNNLLKNYTNQLLENLIQEKYIHLLLRIFGVQI